MVSKGGFCLSETKAVGLDFLTEKLPHVHVNTQLCNRKVLKRKMWLNARTSERCQERILASLAAAVSDVMVMDTFVLMDDVKVPTSRSHHGPHKDRKMCTYCFNVEIIILRLFDQQISEITSTL